MIWIIYIYILKSCKWSAAYNYYLPIIDPSNVVQVLKYIESYLQDNTIIETK